MDASLYRRSRLLVALVAMGWWLGLGTSAIAANPNPEQVEFFEKQVRPILAARCYECHGDTKQEAGLRLDLKAHALKGSDAEPVIKPGAPEESPLITAIRYETTEMPPTAKLSDAEISTLTKWVETGAAWPEDGSDVGASNPASPESIARAKREHWAYQPVREPAAPPVVRTDWVRSPIDAFVLARLEAQNLSPSPPADRRTLLRRVTYDLTGLPPTTAEMDAFNADQAPDAYEKVVDRLLASPAYGERWARHWLDVVRYGDSMGFHAGGVERRYPFAYTYRDYVIRSLNEDLPYDQFLREQLAADLAPTHRDPRALAALGFWTVGSRFQGSVFDVYDDRVDVVTRGLLGLTVTCARCHDHKYDAIPTSDYYSLLGIVHASRDEPEDLPVIEPPAETPEYLAFKAELDKRQHAVDQLFNDEQVKLLEKVRSQTAGYLLDALRTLESPAFTPAVAARVKPLELDERFTLRWANILRRAGDRHDPIFAPWQAVVGLPANEFAFYAPRVWESLGREAERNPQRAVNPLVLQALAADPPQSLAELAERYAALLQNVWGQHQAGAELDARAQQLLALFDGPEAPAAMEPGDLVKSLPAPVKVKLRELRRDLTRWQLHSPHAPARAMVVRDVERPDDLRVFIRGNRFRTGEIAPRRFLAVLSPDERPVVTQGSGRRELAEAIASPQNPLTARVLVNRVWMHHIGEALVRSPSNFGVMGEKPTHPELLDWLAARFMADGWSLKKLHRQIVLSATYCQQSTSRAEYVALDPENRLLWRMNRRRLEFEALRDTLLAASGKLDRTVEGRPFDMNKQPFIARRTVYALLDREQLPSTLPTFNFPSLEASSPERSRTIVPQQALYLMNSPFVIEQAKRLAARPEIASEADPAARVRQLYRIVLLRDPAPDETERALQLIQWQTPPADVHADTAQKLDPWQMLAQVLLLTNEVAYVD